MTTVPMYNIATGSGIRKEKGRGGSGHWPIASDADEKPEDGICETGSGAVMLAVFAASLVHLIGGGVFLWALL